MRPLVVIPLYNEEGTIRDVLSALRRQVPVDVLVVDDGSTDRSRELVRSVPGVIMLCHEENQGYGASLIDGFRYALGHDYEVMVTMDADAQHEPQLIPELLEALHQVDIVSGSRYLPGSERVDPAPSDRVRINQLVTRRLNQLTGLGLTDAFCGFKAYRVARLRALELDEPSYALPLQVWIQAAYHRLSVREVPVSRLYPDPGRRFRGGLEQPCVRLRYYAKVIRREYRRWFGRCSS